MTSQLLAAGEEGANVLRLPLDELIIGTIAFFIVFFALAKFAFPRIKKTLEEREDAIEGGLKRADESQAEAQSLLDQYRQQLTDARAEAAEIRTQAQAERAALIEAARGEATAAAEQVTVRAQAQLEAERQQLRGELTREVGRLSVTLAEKIVGETLTGEARVSATVDRFIADLEAGASSIAVTAQPAPAGEQA